VRTFVVGCNHRTATLRVRERLSFGPDAAVEAMRGWAASFGGAGAEAMLLSTCNRTELYVHRPPDAPPSVGEARDWLIERSRLAAPPPAETFYVYEQMDAVRHLFCVAASLDSMVLGESQVIGQVRTAIDRAVAVGAAGAGLRRLCDRALAAAKAVHTDTDIAAGHLSVASVAVEFARQIFSRFDNKRVVMLGAGKMGALVAEHFARLGCREMTLVGRSADRADAAAAALAARSATLEALDALLGAADIVIGSSAATEPLIDAARFDAARAGREGRAVLIVDLAVPRDVAPEVGARPNVYLYNVDDLQALASETLRQRRGQIEVCYAIVDRHVAECLAADSRRSAGPVLASLAQRMEAIGRDEIDWLLPKLTGSADRDRALIEQFTHRVVGKIMHAPARGLNGGAGSAAVELYAQTLRKLFDLPEERDDATG